MKKVLQFLASLRIHVPCIYHAHVKTGRSYYSIIKMNKFSVHFTFWLTNKATMHFHEYL